MKYTDTGPSKTPHYFKGGKVPKNYDGDPDWDFIGSAGLKTLKAQRALTNYEQKGEPLYDKDGFYTGPGANIAHHTELKKNLEANRKNETVKRAIAIHDYVTKNPDNQVGARIYAQNQMNGAKAYATKMDNKHRAIAYTNGTQGFSMSKRREREARLDKQIKKGK